MQTLTTRHHCLDHMEILLCVFASVKSAACCTKRAARDGRAVFRDGEEMHSALLQENEVEHVMCAILWNL